MQQRAKDFSLGIGVHELEIEDFLQGPTAPCCRYMAKSVLSSSRANHDAASAGAGAAAEPYTPETKGRAGETREWRTPVGGEDGGFSPLATSGTRKGEGKKGSSGNSGFRDGGGVEEEEEEEEEEEAGEEGEDGEDEDDDGFADAEQDFLLSPSGSSRVSSPTARSAQQSHALASDSFYDAIELALDEGSGWGAGAGGGGGGGGGAVPKFGRAGQLLPSFEAYGRDKWEAIEWLEEHIGGTDFVKLQILMVQTDSPDYCGTDMQVRWLIRPWEAFMSQNGVLGLAGLLHQHRREGGAIEGA